MTEAEETLFVFSILFLVLSFLGGCFAVIAGLGHSPWLTKVDQGDFTPSAIS